MIPTDKEVKKQYNQFIDNGVNLLCEIDTLNEDLNILKGDVEEELGKDLAKDFVKRVKARHDLAKKQKTLEDLEKLLQEDEDLKS